MSTTNETITKKDQSNKPGQRALVLKVPEDVYWAFKEAATKARLGHAEYFCTLVAPQEATQTPE